MEKSLSDSAVGLRDGRDQSDAVARSQSQSRLSDVHSSSGVSSDDLKDSPPHGPAPAPRPSYATAARREYGLTSASFNFDEYGDGVDIDDIRDNRSTLQASGAPAFLHAHDNAAEPLSPLFTATHGASHAAVPRASVASTVGFPQYAPPSETPTAPSSTRSRLPPSASRSMKESLSYLNETPIEEYVAKYQVIKVSWRGKYERIFALGPTRFCTIDPKDFEVTNTWPLTSLLSVTLEEGDPEGFTMTLKGVKKDEQLKLKCRFRSHLLSDLFRQQERSGSLGNRGSQTQFPCAKWARKGMNMDGLVEVGKDGVSFLRRDGSPRSTYLYVEMTHLSVLSGSGDGFAFGYGGRHRLFFSERRTHIVALINSAAASLGLALPSRNGLTVASVQQERHQYGTDVGQAFVQFQVHKLTRKYSTPVERTLSLHQNHLVELDVEGGVVSCTSYDQIYVLVRSPRNPTDFDIQLQNGSTNLQYSSRDRDGVLAAIYDLCVTCNANSELFITSAQNERGLRLLPCFATEDTAETHSFFGDTSIGICFLQRMTAVGKHSGSRRSSADRGFIAIVQEFNANVPASGILYDTKQSIIIEALRPIGAQLFFISKGSPIASRSAVTLLQAMFRISSSYYGFREVAQIPQLAEALTNLLANGDEFAVFWTTLLLKKLTVHSVPPSVKLDGPSLKSSEQVEAYNKSVLLGNAQLVQTLIGHLHGIDIKGSAPTANARYSIGPLVIMGLLQTLEGSLCSRKSTTAPGEFQLIVDEVAKFYGTLLKVLFQSRCATTVEACTLLLKAIVEECDPAVATQIRNAALAEGIVLRHLYQAIFDSSFDQRSVSRYLISLWMSHHAPSKQLLSRILPTGFMPLLDEPMPSAAELLEMDQIERQQATDHSSDELIRMSSLSDEQLYGQDGWSNQGKADASSATTGTNAHFPRSSSNGHLADAFSRNRTNSSSTFDTGASLSVAAASVRETVVVQIENDYTKSRMLQKLQSSFLVSASRGGSQTKLGEERLSETSASRDSSRGSKRDSSKSAGNGAMDDSHRMRKRDVAYDFISNAISKSKTQRPHPTKIKGHAVNSPASAFMKDDREPENFRVLFHTLSQDLERIDLIWNANTRAELKRTLLREIQLFNLYQNSQASGKAVWNYEDFKVEYPSLRNEPVVGGCYLRVLRSMIAVTREKPARSDPNGLFGGSAGRKEDDFIEFEPHQVNVRCPRNLIEHLYRRILRENIKAEHHDELEMTIACAEGLTIVASAHACFRDVTELDELNYLVQLILDTVHAPVLQALLRAVRSLALARPNAKKLLEKDTIVDTLVSLLQLGHASDRSHNVALPKAVWSVAGPGDEMDAQSVSIEDLRDMVASEKISPQTVRIVRCDDDVCEHPADHQQPQSMLENLQLRWEVGIQGELSPGQVAQDAIQILLLIAHSNNLIENPVTKNSLFPTVRAKTSVRRRVRDVLPLIARYNQPLLSERTAKLLNFLYDDSTWQRVNGNEALTDRSSLFVWGLFYLVFLVDTLNFDDFAGLLKATHLHQNGFDGASALSEILPDALIDVLQTGNPQEFTQVFNGAVSSPDVVWNRDMRLHLRDNCLAHMDDYMEILQEDVQSHWRFCPMAPVTYAELDNEVWCGGVYLGMFCERDDFKISQPVEFMGKLTRKWRQEVERNAARFSFEEAAAVLGVEFQSTSRNIQPTYRAGFKKRARKLQDEELDQETYFQRIEELREAYRIVTSPRESLLTAGHDPVNLHLLLRAMVVMTDRYAAGLSEYSFDSYDLLLSLLESHATEDGVPPPHTSDEQRLDIAVRAAELLFRTCAVSVRNADVLLRQSSDLDTLENVVHFCVGQMIAEPDTHDARIDEVCYFVFQTITGLLASQAGRMWISDTTTLIVDMARVLWFWNQEAVGKHQRVLLSKTTRQVLEGISRMSMLKANQDRILRTGAIWQLILLFSRYDVALDETVVRSRLGTATKSDEEYDLIADEVQNLLAIMSVRALCRLGGFFSPESELASPRNDDLGAALEALFTPNLSKLLLLESHHEFLKIYHSECESYTLYWNEEMRQEMLSFVRPRAVIEPTQTTDEDYYDAIQFRFDHLAVVFALGDVYVDALVSSLMVLQQSEVPESLNDLGLTERFFRELFSFIDNGKLPQPSFKVEGSHVDGDQSKENEGEVLAFRPHSGWHLQQADLESTFRVTALNCLALTSEVLPYLVERYVSADAQVVKLLLRQLFPPDNEVHQSEEGEADSLVFPDELYEPARYHCIVVLQALSSLNGFGRVSYDVGICDILIEVINMCREVGPQILKIICNLCRTSTRADFVTDILQTGPYVEFISWLVGVEPVEDEEQKELAETLRLPAAELLAEMARSSGALSVESLAMLNRFFPATLTDHLVSDPQEFVAFYQADHETPELIWNSTARDFLRNNLVGLLSEYYLAATGGDDEESSYQLRETARSRVDTHVVNYSSIFPEATVGNVYLSLYLRSPTHRLRDPLYFVRCLWTEFETLYGDLAHLSSSLRQTRSPDDEMMAETGERFLDLVTACLVCALRTNPWLLDEMAGAKIPERCCGYLNECVRGNLSESCSIAVVRMLRVLSTSKKCVATIQPMASNLFTCLMSQMNRNHIGVLYRESAFTLEILRRVVINFPSTIANGEGVVTVAMRVDLFSYLLNIVENPGVLGPVHQPNLVRAIAIDVLNTLEKDRLQARAAHDILKKNKKWEKKYRHEGTPIPIPAVPEDPFLKDHSPDLDRVVSEFSAQAPRVRPSNSTPSTFSATTSVRGTMMDKFRNSPRRGDTYTGSERESVASSNGSGAKKLFKVKKLFSRHS